MKTVFTLLILLSALSIKAQYDCNAETYRSEVFQTVDVTSNIRYGSNINWVGDTVELLFDVYHSPENNDPIKPAIVLAHGGFFLQGSKEGLDVTSVAQRFAKMGYVVFSVGYRLGIPVPPDSAQVAEAVYRATQDFGAMVRYLKKDVVEGANTYKIDTNHLYIGGVSAGGFMALHLAFMDEVSKVPPFIDTTKFGMQGGLAGLSGNPGYSTKVSGVINIAGAIGDTAWIDANNAIPVFSVHGTNDITVPIGSDFVRFSFLRLITVDGSASIHRKMDDLGALNCFRPFQGAGHVPHADPSDGLENLDTTMAYASQFLFDLLCNSSLTCDVEFGPASGTSSVISKSTIEMSYLANGALRLDLKEAKRTTITISNIEGRTVYTQSYTQDIIELNPTLSPGVYLVNAISNDGSSASFKWVQAH